MDDSNSEDFEMECDFINRPSLPPCYPGEADERPTDRANTPPNSSSISSDFCFTPLSNFDGDSEAGVKRVGLERNLFNRHKFTSTPLFFGKARLSTTLPNAHPTSQLPQANDLRPSKSSESIKPLMVGPEEIPYEYVNPFTPDGKLIANKTNAQKRFKRLSINSALKFDLSDTTESDGQSNADSEIDVPVRSRLSEFNVSRFNEEFVQLKEIGKGDHGCVYKCLNRMNGCVYAIKRSIKPIKSSIQERVVRNEIYAHAVLDHNNIVRNYSCWKEEGFVFIQNEYCNGGSLEQYIQCNVMSEALLRSLLLQISHALRYIHKKGLAHMDIKPGNIFLRIDRLNKENSMDSDGGFSDDDKIDEIIFKLGDLGHITRLDEENDVEEGDCRYLPREILEEKFTHLDRADVFALGLTVYEAAGVCPLPKNGDEWQEIRNGNLKHLDQYSEELNDILKIMVHPTPVKRPTPAELIKMVKPNPPPDDVFDYLQQYRLNNTLLERKVETTGQYLRVLFKSHKQLQEQLISGKDKIGEKLQSLGKKKGAVTKTRVVGRKTKRSSSTTMF